MIPILMYHQIGEPAPRGTPYRGLTVHPRDFRRQMRWLRRLGYRGLSMRDLLPYLRGAADGAATRTTTADGGEGHGGRQKLVGITFDDGYRNVYRNAMPVLAEVGFTATNYFVARQTDGANVWDLEKGIPRSPLMSLREVREWAAAGHEVGSHTLDHVHLPELSPDQARQQILQSKQALEQAVGMEVAAFCYPYGDESNAVRQWVREAGYSNATTTERGLARPDDDLFGLPRVTVSGSVGIVRFLRKCLTHSEDRRRRAR
jgi:peptidoglycan/xylan/chitin deacetylase (PgdA/CDA1 family)